LEKKKEGYWIETFREKIWDDEKLLAHKRIQCSGEVMHFKNSLRQG